MDLKRNNNEHKRKKNEQKGTKKEQQKIQKNMGQNCEQNLNNI